MEISFELPDMPEPVLLKGFECGKTFHVNSNRLYMKTDNYSEGSCGVVDVSNGETFGLPPGTAIYPIKTRIVKDE
jgi:hypothetical protein